MSHGGDGRAQVFHAACDEQRLYSLDMRNDTKPFQPLIYSYGTVEPNNRLHTHQHLSDFAAGVVVGRVRLDRKLPNLPIEPDVWHTVKLTLNTANNEWTAKVSGSPATYQVRRFGYAGLDTEADFPMTARWDWFKVNGVHEQVMGFPCARAWCLIGMTSVSTTWPDPRYPELDPMDPDNGVSPPRNPRTKRVRGWFDRMLLANGTSAYLYPSPRLEEFIETDFDESENPHREVAYLEVDGRAAVPIELYTVRGVWTSQTKSPANTKPPIIVNHNGNPGYSYNPGVARFGKTQFGLNLLANADGVTTRLTIGDGDMWVRCASGCCNATIAQ